MKNYVSLQEIMEIYCLSHQTADEIIKNYCKDKYKDENGVYVKFLNSIISILYQTCVTKNARFKWGYASSLQRYNNLLNEQNIFIFFFIRIP